MASSDISIELTHNAESLEFILCHCSRFTKGRNGSVLIAEEMGEGAIQMKRKNKKQLSRQMLMIALIIPILLCTVIILGIISNLFFHLAISKSGDGQTTVIEAIYNDQSLVLSLIGIAISVWIGLNIYNVLSREELKHLLEQAERASEITERVYTEALKSKFRVSFSDRTASYFVTQLDSIDRLSDVVLEKMLELEDLFNFSYNLYCENLSTQFNETGVEKAEALIEYAEKQRQKGFLSKEQLTFLLGYCSLREGDFLYFRIQYDKSIKGDELERFVKKAVELYKKSLYNLFRIRDLRHCDNPEIYKPEERITLAILANNIGSVYLLKPQILDKLDETQLNEIIAAEKVAVLFSNEISDLVRSVYVRNLGVAYERKGEWDYAFKQYCEAFRLNRKSWKTAHCIGSWYGKRVTRMYPTFPLLPSGKEADSGKMDAYYKNLENYIARLKKADKEKISAYLLESVYWYEIKAANKDRLVDERVVVLYKQLRYLTQNERGKEAENVKYRTKEKESEEKMEYQQKVLNATDKRKEA